MGADEQSRGGLRKAIEDRLDRFTSGDVRAVLELRAMEQAQALRALLRVDDRDVESRFTLGWLYWRRYEVLGDAEDERQAVDMLVLCFLTGTEVRRLPGALLPVLGKEAVRTAEQLSNALVAHPDPQLATAAVEIWTRILDVADFGGRRRATTLSNLGAVLQTRYDNGGAAEDLDKAIGCFRQALSIVDPNDPNAPMIRSNLLSAVNARFARHASQADLEETVHVYRQSIATVRADHPRWWDWHADLALSLMARWEFTGARPDLEEGITKLREVIDGAPAGHPRLNAWRSQLGMGLESRFRVAGDWADIDEGIGIHRRVVADTQIGDADRANHLTELGDALTARFYFREFKDDIDEAITVHREALDATSPEDPARLKRLSMLGSALETRSSVIGGPHDLEEAITLLREATAVISADDIQAPDRLFNLGNALRARFQQTRQQADLDEAIDLLRRGVAAAPPGSPGRANRQAALGIALHLRFGHTGGPNDLDEAIEAHQEAVAASGPTDPERPRRLSNLARTLSSRATWTGTLADLNRAIDALQKAVKATGVGDAAWPARLCNLGGLLYVRFNHSGARADLDMAVRILREVVSVSPDDHPERPLFEVNLGMALRIRFERFRNPADLDKAIEQIRAALGRVPASDEQYAKLLAAMGMTLSTRFRLSRDLADLDEAIAAHRKAVSAVRDDAPDRAMILSTLGIALGLRAEHTGDEHDEDEAVHVMQESVALAPPNHPDLGIGLSHLGDALLRRFRRTGAQEDSAAAADAFARHTALTAVPPSDRVRTARLAAALTMPSELTRAARLLAAAVELVPEIAPRELERPDVQHAVRRLTGLAPEAAALTLQDTTLLQGERAPRALQLLEAGRAVLLSQALDTRSDLTDLRAQHPELADRYVELRSLLDRSPEPGQKTEVRDVNGEATVSLLPADAFDRRQLAGEFVSLVARIRARDGFSSFGRTPVTSDLVAQAGDGPIVVFNTSTYRTDALLVTSAGVTAVPLPGASHDTLINQINNFHRALRTASAGATSRARMAAQKQLSQVLRWLWDTIAEPVLLALGFDHAPGPGKTLPRIWWAPGGLLGLLPVHAAGHHTDSPDDPGARTVMDRVVFSYTPTIRALRHARQRTDHGRRPGRRALIVAMPTTPGLPGEGRLHHVRDEAAVVASHLADSDTLIEPDLPHPLPSIGNGYPTRVEVLNRLPVYSIAHFACHGTSFAGDPSQSHLLLHDHATAPFTVAALAPYHLDNADLAYLSACGTALSTNAELIDESIHLAAAFQLAGYPQVIGTLWEINDHHAVDVASSFYAGLTDEKGTVDPKRAARALHGTVVTARNALPQTPSLWAAYIHVGA
ncbi:CHAT domain-containing protein [Streptomyces lacrimifluminis]|uniref:CHAT domain-containing protein n=1 Tax=Streptomyces lacrimifluminis TaxID=1500077 RepID=A0A917PAV0_9ACTN|nr:CHAT domain-containing tetratricopeptide repeat protein [Streptomyces lacrimifluminis]GGJ69004.1 CHAT domain-containing protein [Streptomyces lacrimifluminis]